MLFYNLFRLYIKNGSSGHIQTYRYLQLRFAKEYLAFSEFIPISLQQMLKVIILGSDILWYPHFFTFCFVQRKQS